MTTTQIGDLVTGKGVYAGIDKINHVTKEAYFEPDFLRDASGKQLILNFSKAGDVLAERNGGRRYGNGSDVAVRKAITHGEYQDGDLVLAPQEFLSGRDAGGNMVRPDNLVSLLRAGKESLKRIRDTINSTFVDDRWSLSGAENHRWSISGKEHPGASCCVYHVKLTDGYDGWLDKDCNRSGVVPLRYFSPAS